MATATQSGSAQIVDFSNVKDGGGSFNKKRMPEGDYAAKITLCADAPAKDGTHQWLYSLQMQINGQTFPYYCKLQENQLWKLRNLFLAAGIQVPKKKMKVDPNKIVGRLIGVTLEDDEYDGKAQSQIAAVFPAADLTSNDEDADDLDDAEDEDEDDEEEAPAPKKKAAKKAPVVEEDDEDEEEDDEDEEEEEPAPVVKKKAKPAAAPAKKVAAKKKAPAVTEDDLEELDLDDI